MNGGMVGSVNYVIIFLLVIISIIFPYKYKNLVILVLLISTTLLFVLEYYHPELIITYENKFIHTFDLNFTIILVMLSIYIIINYLKKSYDNEREKALKSKKEIEQQNKILEHNTFELDNKNKYLEKLNQNKNQLISIIAHDLRSPLTSGISVIKLAIDEEITKDELKNILPEIDYSLSQTLSLLDNLLFWTRSQLDHYKPEIEKINIRKIVEDKLHEYKKIAQSKKIEVIFENNAKNQEGWIEKQTFEMVLRNLFSNSLKFSYSCSKIFFNLSEDEYYLLFQVKDEGVGISPENLNKIKNFKILTTKGTNQESGTGIGLFLCQDLLYKNNCILDIESKIGEGTTMTMFIPLMKV
ncbi:MAG: hypothetical protein OHK0038_17690 [Flammeovirgaceae bacterium]